MRVLLHLCLLALSCHGLPTSDDFIKEVRRHEEALHSWEEENQRLLAMATDYEKKYQTVKEHEVTLMKMMNDYSETNINMLQNIMKHIAKDLEENVVATTEKQSEVEVDDNGLIKDEKIILDEIFKSIADAEGPTESDGIVREQNKFSNTNNIEDSVNDRGNFNIYDLLNQSNDPTDSESDEIDWK